MDKAKGCADIVKANAESLGVTDRVTVVCGDATSALQRIPAGAASLALCDPPYALENRSALLAGLARALLPGGTLVFETAEDDGLTEAPPLFEKVDARAYGSTVLHRFVRI